MQEAGLRGRLWRKRWAGGGSARAGGRQGRDVDLEEGGGWMAGWLAGWLAGGRVGDGRWVRVHRWQSVGSRGSGCA